QFRNANFQEGLSFSIGAINIGSSRSIGLQIGIINYCPNNTIPIMIMANYCTGFSKAGGNTIEIL
ncbi:LA_2272 family surface repeat-containing protein, partial [Leptospira borgpetersenii]|uniref:LA_2272 family surface repeat-containing protein n=1 Tax=Leptospira borgpetersenii TaxID=174 RepID=UPI0006ACFD2C